MNNLKNLIIYFIRNFPRDSPRTELVKLIFLFEYNSINSFGKQYSGVNFIRDNYGPNDLQIVSECDGLAYKNVIVIEEYETS